jgi:hypothetical protein
MTAITKEIVRRALLQFRGDDLERAKRAFSGMNKDQMSKPYGQSGRSCKDILEGYERHNEQIDIALKELGL